MGGLAERLPAHALFDAVRPLASRFPCAGGCGSGDLLTDAADLDRVLPPVANDAGMRLRFLPPADDGLDYERRVADLGVVATRGNSWHDLFNAFVWCLYPRTKAALNRRHVTVLRTALPAAPRGRVRDAATQFDEDGMLLLHDAPELVGLLARHRWVEALWERRDALRCHVRFLVFGHALLDKLRNPFPGLCAKTLALAAPRAVLDADVAAQVAWADSEMSARLDCHAFLATPRALHPLPVLGIPGMSPAAECRDYYLDEGQFRPLATRA